MDYMASCHGSYDLHYSLARILYTLLLHMHTSSNSLGLLTLFLLRNEKTLANLQSKEPLNKKPAHVRGMTLTLNVTLPSLQYQGEQTLSVCANFA